MDRAYIDYEKFNQLTERGVIYVTKMKKSLKYTVMEDTMYQTPDGLMQVRTQTVEFVKQKKGAETSDLECFFNTSENNTFQFKSAGLSLPT